MFKRNEGILDRIVRVALATVLLATGLLLYGLLHVNVPGLVTAGFGAWLMVTGLTGVCPLYIPFGFSTLEIEKKLIAKCKSMMASRDSGGYACGGRMCGPFTQATGETQNKPGQTA